MIKRRKITTQELRAMSDGELVALKNELNAGFRELSGLKLAGRLREADIKTGVVRDRGMEYRETRKNIARLNTVVSERTRGRMK